MLADMLTDALKALTAKDKRFSQQWLAAEVGVSRATVSRWLTGDRSPEPHHLVALGRVLGLDPGTLVVAQAAKAGKGRENGKAA